MSEGRTFHAESPACEKDRSPNLFSTVAEGEQNDDSSESGLRIGCLRFAYVSTVLHCMCMHVVLLRHGEVSSLVRLRAVWKTNGNHPPSVL